jgi:type IV pilus assembly protein PilA
MNNLKEKKLNNSGFSLVELIIVIAIMAVLIGVLAPQYLKYVEKSRKSADLDNYQAVITAVQVYYSDPANALPAAGDYNFVIDADGKVTTGASGTASEITKACSDAGVDVTKITMKSNAYKDKTVVFTVTAKGKSGFSTSDTTLAGELSIGTTKVSD